MIPIVSRGALQQQKTASPAEPGIRSPLAQLLHALNQPLTGLQCSMEVALAVPRTSEQYAQGLRAGLELTERMRALVGAIREVVDGEEENERNDDEPNNDVPERPTDLQALLREVLDDLGPVAEVNRVRIALDDSADSSLWVRFERRRLSGLLFRTLESVLSLAEPGSVLRIETGGRADPATNRAGFSIGWSQEMKLVEFSRPELGLLVAQAGWERAGAIWERERTGNLERVTVKLRGK